MLCNCFTYFLDGRHLWLRWVSLMIEMGVTYDWDESLMIEMRVTYDWDESHLWLRWESLMMFCFVALVGCCYTYGIGMFCTNTFVIVCLIFCKKNLSDLKPCVFTECPWNDVNVGVTVVWQIVYCIYYLHVHVFSITKHLFC